MGGGIRVGEVRGDGEREGTWIDGGEVERGKLHGERKGEGLEGVK